MNKEIIIRLFLEELKKNKNLRDELKEILGLKNDK